MTFGDHVVLWLHVTAAVFTIGPGTAAIMSTPRYIRKGNPVVVGYLFRTTRIYAFAALLTLIFGLILTGMTHRFSQWWISVSLTLFIVAFVLLMVILRDQRKALAALEADEGSTATDAADGRGRSASPSAASGETVADPDGGAQPSLTATAEAPRVTGNLRGVVERGRIASLGGLTALIWLVILVFMVWH